MQSGLKMKRVALCLASLLLVLSSGAGAAGLGLKRVYFPQASFDANAARQSLISGSSSIRGVAYYNDPMGTGTYYARGSVVMLFPVTDYFSEWLRLTEKFSATQHEVYMLPEAFAARKEAVTDDNGNFVFDGLKPGRYFLETIIDYQSTGVASQQTGTVVGVMGGAGYSYPTYSHYTYRFNAQKRAAKQVVIETSGQMLPVKLRPGMGPFLRVGGLAALAGSSSLCYQVGNLQNGTCKEYHPNGQMMSEAEWKDHRFHGAYKEYDEQGRLLAVGEFEKGKKTGEWLIYAPGRSKTLQRKEHYKLANGESVAHGDIEFYYPSGSLQQIDRYANGKIEGMTHFYESGRINLTAEFEAGVQHGETVLYDENGVVKERRLYRDGKPVSEPAKTPR